MFVRRKEYRNPAGTLDGLVTITAGWCDRRAQQVPQRTSNERGTDVGLGDGVASIRR
jgi:hypothetical protein